MTKKSTKRRTYKKKAAKSTVNLVKLIKAVNIKEAEVKYKTLSYTLASIKQNGLQKTDLWSSTINLFPGQNNTDSGRIGDRIIAQGIMLRAVFDIPWDRKNVKLKAFYIPFNSDQGGPDTYGNLFHSVTGISRLDPLQKKRYPGIKYLGTYQIEPERAPYYTYSGGDQTPDADVISANTGTICIKKWLPMYNKKVFFRSDATNQPSNLKENGSIVLVPYASNNTAQPILGVGGDTVILGGNMSATLYYKDI